MSRRLRLVIAVVLTGAAIACAWYFTGQLAASSEKQAVPAKAIPVTAGVAVTSDVPIYLPALGTVQAFNTVTVRARVDGQLDKVAFTEGQVVKQGDLLAQIDPRPFQSALDQAKANLAKDDAMLRNAKLDLQRFVNLGEFATKQSVDTQQALVRQLEATLQADQAAIESAQVQLDYTTITSPLVGRTGIRLVDQGNIVHATDANGLVVITQLQPISVIFTLPEDRLPDVFREMALGPLTALAMDRASGQELGQGVLALVDNLIDQTTGTIRLKATFPNDRQTLWPGQFVDIRLRLQTLHQVVTVPSPAVQRGPDGSYVYVIGADSTVAMRPISVRQLPNGTAVIDQGVQAGEHVVVSGQYRLQQGSVVQPQATAIGVAGAT